MRTFFFLSREKKLKNVKSTMASRKRYEVTARFYGRNGTKTLLCDISSFLNIAAFLR